MVLSEEQLQKYLSLLHDRLRTGSDRTSAEKFLKICDEEFKLIRKKILNNQYRFTSLRQIHITSNRSVFIPTVRDRLVMEHLKVVLHDKYKVVYSDRNAIIRTLISKLKQGMDYYVVRLDIHKFFDSIPQQRIVSKLRDSALLSYEEYSLVTRAINLVSKGIPQGLPISNALSEIYLESFDFQLKKVHPRINFYSRYVDDILILINGDLTPTEEILLNERIAALFKSFELKMNNAKTRFLHMTMKASDCVSYLGYNFRRPDVGELCIGIDDDKLKKLHDKIDFIFREYRLNKNVKMLKERLTYITSKNVVIKTKKYVSKRGVAQKRRKIYYGPIETYRWAQDDVWTRLDNYLKQKVKSVSKSVATRADRRTLYSYSFTGSHSTNRCNRIYKYRKNDFLDRIQALSGTLPQGAQRMSMRQLSHLYFSLLDMD